METRPNLHARLTDEAMEGYERVCEEAGITKTALLEAAGLYYYEGGQASPEFIARAQELTRSRLRRRERPDDN